MSQRNLRSLLLAIAVAYVCYVRGDQNPYARYVATGLNSITKGALEPVPSADLFSAAMEGMVAELRRQGDDHSQFLPEEEADPLRADIRQQFGGIGVRIAFEGEPPRLLIVAPPDTGTPAAKANLLPGHEILAIDDESTEGMTMATVLGRMRGQPGTKVRLLVQTEQSSEPQSIELTREVIHIESILGDRRGDDGQWEFRFADYPQIAHIRIASFGDRTAVELAGILDHLTVNGVAAVVLDLRDNAGGALEAAVAVCEMFLSTGSTVVETRGRGKELRKRYATRSNGHYRDLPLVVVVNQNSASAAEIVAACLQDHDRAIVVGQRTFGKGTVQQLIPLEAGRSLLKLTWASFWRPSGEPIHRVSRSGDDNTWGVVPNAGFELTLSQDEYASYRKYRTRRDAYPSRRQRPSSDEKESTDPNYTDDQLQFAIDHLLKLGTEN